MVETPIRRSALANISLVAAMLALLVLPLVQMRASLVEEVALNGVSVAAPLPKLDLASVRSERFQAEAKAWFEQHYGLKPTLVRLDNTVGYRLLGDTRWESLVHRGKDDMLFNTELVTAFNRPPSPPEEAVRSARLVHAAYEALRREGKVLVLVVIPSKISIFGDRLGPKLRDPLLEGLEPRPWRARVDEYLRELYRLGLPFVDGPKLLAKLAAEQPDLLYTREARHFNAPGECMLFDAALDLARPLLPGRSVRSLDCAYEFREPLSVYEEEYDLYRLLNVWGEPATKRIAFLNPSVPELAPASDRPDTLIVGSSFGGRYLLESTRNRATGRTHFFYYNRRLIFPDLSEAPLPRAGSPEWRDLVLTKELFLLPAPEEYLPDHFDAFTQQILDALARR